VAFAPDGRILAVGGSVLPGGRFIGTLWLWDPATGKERARPAEHGGGVHSLAFTPDGKTLATTSLDDATVKLWEVATGKERAVLKGVMHGNSSPAFTSDGSILAAGGPKEGTVVLWDLPTGKELAMLKGNANAVHVVAFTPDGKTLAAAEGPDTTIRLWDVSGLTRARKRPTVRRSDDELEASWAALAGADATAAYRATWELAAAPGQAVPLLKARLRAVAPPDPTRVARLIADLDSDDFAVREQATRALADLGESALPALRKVLAGRPSAETRQRVEPLLAELEQPANSPECLRVLRAVEVLEHIGTAEARRVLDQLATGLVEARVTQEAKASLSRLAGAPAAEK
jgi:dipeptidyl aminopeptidase/acylaminoacyl peptidase